MRFRAGAQRSVEHKPRPATQAAAAQIVVVQNRTEELKRLAPATR
jgi:hypothetical protein